MNSACFSATAGNYFLCLPLVSPLCPYSFRNRSMQHTPQIFLISPPAFLPAPLRSKVTVSPSSSTFFQLLCCVCTDEEERGRMWESTFFAACQGKKGVFCQCHEPTTIYPAATTNQPHSHGFPPSQLQLKFAALPDNGVPPLPLFPSAPPLVSVRLLNDRL